MSQYSSFVPLGQISITAAGTTTALSVNCGNYGGQQGTGWKNPPVPGNAWRAMVIIADTGNSGNLFLLPRGKTAAGNPEAIFGKIGIGGSLPFPNAVMLGVGFTPENFVLDTDATSGTQLAFGYGVLG